MSDKTVPVEQEEKTDLQRILEWFCNPARGGQKLTYAQCARDLDLPYQKVHTICRSKQILSDAVHDAKAMAKLAAPRVMAATIQHAIDEPKNQNDRKLLLQAGEIVDEKGKAQPGLSFAVNLVNLVAKQPLQAVEWQKVLEAEVVEELPSPQSEATGT